jgi:hypothetical protein
VCGLLVLFSIILLEEHGFVAQVVVFPYCGVAAEVVGEEGRGFCV